jgi:hypothetical protein
MKICSTVEVITEIMVILSFVIVVELYVLHRGHNRVISRRGFSIGKINMFAPEANRIGYELLTRPWDDFLRVLMRIVHVIDERVSGSVITVDSI